MGLASLELWPPVGRLGEIPHSDDVLNQAKVDELPFQSETHCASALMCLTNEDDACYRCRSLARRWLRAGGLAAARCSQCLTTGLAA
jgi:hypothetical protein